MIVLLNPKAAGWRAIQKWNAIAPLLSRSVESFDVHLMNGTATAEHTISNALANGEKDFVAAGGDGTINLLLNILLTAATREQLHRIRIGAVGLGSSNDFHKPFRADAMMRGIPMKMSFSTAQCRDVGCLTYDQDEQSLTKYFLVNASIGVTAEANHLFNHPDGILAVLKRAHTHMAILYAALKTIMIFKNIRVTIQGVEDSNITTAISNLGILKNQHFAGSLRYDTPARGDDGNLLVNLSHNMTKAEIFMLLLALRRGKFSALQKTKSWKTASMCVTASSPFAVEFDGEVITTTSAQFAVLPQYIKVCS